MRLDCCNFDVGQSDGHSLEPLGMGEAHKTEFNGFRFRGECPDTSPGGKFYTVWGKTVDHVQSFGGKPQRSVWGCFGCCWQSQVVGSATEDYLGWSLTSDLCLSSCFLSHSLSWWEFWFRCVIKDVLTRACLCQTGISALLLEILPFSAYLKFPLW